MSVEAGAPPGQDRVSNGIAATRARGKWWMDNHIVHSAQVMGPYPHDDRFAVRFVYDVTSKPMGNKRVYTVKDGKIVREVGSTTRGSAGAM